MIKKALVVTSFATGYVLGAKAGRERYLQIRSLFLRVTNDPFVQEKLHEAVDLAQDLRPHSATVGAAYAANS